MVKKFNYVYVTTCLINNKQYIGDRSCNCDPSKDPYLGSGTYFKNAIRKYGKENFKKEILGFFDDAQEKWINEYITLSPNGYNISPKGGYGIPNSFLSKETRYKIGMAHTGKISKYLSEFNTLNKKGKSYEDQMINIYGEKEGIRRSKEYKNKIKIATSGSNNPMYNNGDKITGSKNGMYEKTHSEETKKKMRKPRSDEARKNIKIAQRKRRLLEKEKKLWQLKNSLLP